MYRRCVDQTTLDGIILYTNCPRPTFFAHMMSGRTGVSSLSLALCEHWCLLALARAVLHSTSCHFFSLLLLFNCYREPSE